MKIAMIDSGIPKTDIKNIENIKIIIGIDFKLFYDFDEGYDYNGHGTEVFNIIKKYLCEEDEILNIKILDEALRGHSLCLIKAIEIAIDKKCHVINISLGTTNETYIKDLLKVIKIANEKGIIVVAANSNEGKKSYPANFKEVYGIFNEMETVSYNNELKNFYINNIQYENGEELIGNSFVAPHISGIILNLLRKKEKLNTNLILEKLLERIVT